MGYEILTGAGNELAAAYRDRFPVTQNLVYLNHAAVAPLCRPAADAMKHLADDACRFGSYHYDQWLDAYEGLRVAAARLINADRSEIAIVKNTSEGIATVAMGIGWRRGDKVVAFKEEFPANYYPWKRLESHGVHVEWLSVYDSLDRMEAAARGARLLAISYVQFLSGYRADLKAIGDICRRHGCFFFVDAIQGMGAYPIDVRECGIHALSADGHKWMLGPEGCGVLYIDRQKQEGVFPEEFGWTNVANFADYGSRDMTLRSDAGRYEPGTLNTIGIYGVRAAIEFLLDVGVDRIAPAVTRLADRVAEGARAKGYELLHGRAPETAAGIVSLRKPGADCRALYADLKRKNFITAPRDGWLRVSPHFYVTTDEIDAFLDELP